MARKRDARPEVVAHQDPIALARKVVTLLDERTDTESHRRAIYLLVTNGPCFGDDASSAVRLLSPDEIAVIAQALQVYLRNAVRTRIPGTPIDLSGVRIYTVRSITSAVSFMAGPVLGQAGLALMLLLHLVGLQNFWACSAPDCPRIFVKRWRREYCSARCQRRTFKRQEREGARVQRARRAGRK